MANWRSKELRLAMRILAEITKARALSPTTKAVYLAAMLKQPESISKLAQSLGMHKGRTAACCSTLERQCWMQFAKEGTRRRPCAALPAEVEAALAEETREEMRLAQWLGEETTKRFVDWIVAPSVLLVHNSRPAFLGSPRKEKNLELDIFAPDYLWGMEHQGYQHYGPSSQYSNAQEFVEQHKRDVRKAYLCKKNKVRLSEVSVLDLTLAGMLAAIPADIPRRTFDPKGPYIQMLEQVGKELAGSDAQAE